MLNQLQEFAKATDQAMCKIFDDYGNELTALATIALIAPPTRPVGYGIALAQTAARHGCTWDPEKNPDFPVDVPDYEGCKQYSNLGVWNWYKEDGTPNPSWTQEYKTLLEVVYRPDATGLDWTHALRFIDSGGDERFEIYRDGASSNSDFSRTKPYGFTTPANNGDTCEIPAPKPPAPIPAPDTYTTVEGCTLIVNFESWGQLPDGSMEPIMRIEPSAETKASGGIIGGCNFEPTIYYGGNGGGGGGGDGPVTVPYLPEPDPDGNPFWQKLLDAALAGAAGAATKLALEKILAKVYEGTTYSMEAPCDKDEDGNPLVWEKEIPPAPSTDALGYRLTAIHEQISQALAWKTPICNEKPELEGEWRTISFRSESSSPYGHARLRKRFRYRSTSGLGLGEIVDHWNDFSFESGSVVVCHSGSSWGTPQVWAATADEGKRVIRHAAGEAGIDPDQVGRWTISSSSSARYGVSDTMRVDTTGGYYWITARDGSNSRPIVATTPDPYGSGLDRVK